MQTVYRSFDGHIFESQHICAEYEAEVQGIIFLDKNFEKCNFHNSNFEYLFIPNESAREYLKKEFSIIPSLHLGWNRYVYDKSCKRFCYISPEQLLKDYKKQYEDIQLIVEKLKKSC